MGFVRRSFAVLPFSNRLSRDVVESGKWRLGECRSPHFLTDHVRRARLAVLGLGHQIGSRVSLKNSVPKTCVTLKSGQLRIGK